jgi:uncharacterized protein YybS (DUF2232 family)
MSHARTIVTGALCALALSIGGLLGPPGAQLALVVLPLPMLVVGGAAGATHAAASSLAAGGLLGGLLGWPFGLSFVLLAGIPAVCAVVLLRGAYRLEWVVGGAFLAMALGGVAMALAFAPPPTTWPSVLTEAWNNGFDTVLGTYHQLGISADQLADLEAQREQLTHAALAYLPAITIVAATALWLANLRMSARWACWPQLDGLSRWRVPDAVIWTLIGSGFALFAPHPSAAVVAGNVFVVVIACYFAQGVAIVSYFFQRYGLPRGIRALTYVVIAFHQIATALVIALGVFDLWGDFRHLTARPADAAVGSDSD